MPDEREIERQARRTRRKNRKSSDSFRPVREDIRLSREELRRGVLLSEILRPPRALRPFRPQDGKQRDR